MFCVLYKTRGLNFVFYDIFKQLCDKKGVSCNKAALELGLSNATVPKWRRTGATPHGQTLIKIADYFGVTTDYLLNATEKAPTVSGERSISDDELKFALWGNSDEIDDDDLEDVRRYAAFVRERKKAKK